jgi:hypothetical protein
MGDDATIRRVRQTYSKIQEFLAFVGAVVLTFIVSALVTGGHAAAPTYHESPIATGMINIAARYVPSVHTPAIARIEAKCVSTLGVSGVGQQLLNWTDAAALSTALKIPFVGLGERVTGAAANTRLVICDTGAWRQYERVLQRDLRRAGLSTPVRAYVGRRGRTPSSQM